MYTIKEIIQPIEMFAPLSFQESWDNSGLIIGSMEQPVNAALLTIDITESVVQEAIEQKAQIIIGHHPLIFSGIKRFTGSSEEQRAVTLAIKHDIAVYVAHTNMDVAPEGVSHRMAAKLGLVNTKVLAPQDSGLCKLVTFVPIQHIEAVQQAVFEAGAGHTGNYDSCGYSTGGKGSFRALENSNPFVGKHGELHYENEVRFETVFPVHLQKKIITSLINAHPYEEVAYDIYKLQNINSHVGLGITGDLSIPAGEADFLRKIKSIFSVPALRHTGFRNRNIQRVALCGGSGSSLVKNAIRDKADIFITADFKYHQFADAGSDILIADIGHYESEQFTKEIFHEILMKNFPNFAVYFSKIKTNPINYI